MTLKIEYLLKKVIFILSLCSLILVSSCSVFESKLMGSGPQIKISTLDTALSFTKSVIGESEVEKKVFSRAEDSLLFFDDLNENESFLLAKLISLNKNTIKSDSLKKLGLDYDSIQITSNETQSKATFYSNKKSALFDVKKTYYITFKENKIYSKTIKIEQKLLHESSKKFEINYNYNY